MSSKKLISTSGAQITRVLAPQELNARRQRKAFTAPLDPPHQALEPKRNTRRTMPHPGTLPVRNCPNR